MIPRQIESISCKSFYDQLWAEKAPYSMYLFIEKLGCWNVKSNGWKVVNKQKQMVIKYTAPVKGVPFCTETTATQTLKVIEHTPNKLIIEGESITDDAPYCDTFTC